MKKLNDAQWNKLFVSMDNLDPQIVAEASDSVRAAQKAERAPKSHKATKWVIVAAATVALVAVMFTCFILNGVVRERWGQPGTTSQNPSFSITETPGTTGTPNTTGAPTITESPITTTVPGSTEAPETTGTPEATAEPGITEHIHDYGDWIVDEPATCTENGKQHKVCKLCEDVISEMVPAMGHDYDVNDICARCGASGLEEGTLADEKFRYSYRDSTKELRIIGEGDIRACLELRENGKNRDYVENWKIFTARSVRSMVFEEGITGIGAELCDPFLNLERVSLPSTLKTIGWKAFAHTCLTEVILPEGLTEIRDHAFWGCENLDSVTIPASVTNIGTFAFSPTTVVSVDENNKKYRMEGNCLIDIADQAVIWMGNGAVLPEDGGIKKLLGAGTEGAVYIPASVEIIGEYAFMEDAANDGTAFASVSDIRFAPGSQLRSVGRSAFAGCEFEELRLPEGIETIGDDALGRCYVKRIILPDSVKSIGECAFEFCINLTEITIPEGVQIIRQSSFELCNQLTRITLPASITEIHPFAFDEYGPPLTVEFAGTSVQWDAIIAKNSVKLPEGSTVICKGE